MDVSLRELNSSSSAVVRRAQAGEHVVITDRGVAIAEVIPYEHKGEPPSWDELVVAFRNVSGYDHERLRNDLDGVADPWE